MSNNKTNNQVAGLPEFKIHLTPVNSIAESMILAVEASQIHNNIMTLVRLKNMFSEELPIKDAGENQSELVDFLAKKCHEVYEDKEQLELYIHNAINTLIEAEDFNYSFRLPKMFIMVAFSKTSVKKKTDIMDGIEGISQDKKRNIVTLNDEGFYVFTKDFSDSVKVRSVMDPDFMPNLLKQIWVKRMSENNSFSMIKKKLEQQLKDSDMIQEIQKSLHNYINKEKKESIESTNAIQLMRSEVSKLQKE